MARNITHKCLCILCALIVVFSNAVPSHAVVATLGAITTAAEAGNTVGELFGRVLEDFFGLNHQCTLTEATLITINRSLDAIFTNTYGYDIVNPYTGGSGTMHVSSRTFGQMMADINNSIATTGIRYLEPISSNILGVSNSISVLNQQMNNALYDYNHIGQTSFSVGSTSRNTAVNTQNINNAVRNIDWNTLVDGTFIDSSGNVINSQTQVTPNNSNYYFKFDFSGMTNEFAILKLVLPLVSGGRNGNDYTLEFYEMNGSGTIIRFPDPKYIYEYDTAGTNLIVYISDYFYNFSNVLVRVIPSYQYYFFGGSANIPHSYYLTSVQQDYLDVSQYIFLRKNMNILEDIYNKDITVDVTLDTSDILEAINDISLVDNDIKLTPVIDTNLPTNGTNIVDRLRMYFSTGVTVNQFFNAVDNAELGWYDQENSDVINTLSGGYVNLYE